MRGIVRISKVARRTRINKNKKLQVEEPYNFLGPINKLTPSDAIVRGIGDGAIIMGASVFVALGMRKLFRFLSS